MWSACRCRCEAGKRRGGVRLSVGGRAGEVDHTHRSQTMPNCERAELVNIDAHDAFDA